MNDCVAFCGTGVLRGDVIALGVVIVAVLVVRIVRSSWRRITAGMPDPGYPLDDEWRDGVGE